MLAERGRRRRATAVTLRVLHLGRRGAAAPTSGERWRDRFGVDILDGIGSTEMLHIFLSNRPGDVRYGTTGLPVPGYEHAAGRRRRPGGRPARVEGRVVGERADRRRPCTGTTASAVARHVPRAVDAHRRQLRPRRRRLLHLLRARRRHAQGRRHLGLAVRGRGRPCSATPRCSRPRSSATPDDDELIKPKAFVVARRRRPRPGRELAAALQQYVKKTRLRAPTSTRAGSSSAPSCRRPRPARSSAFGCAAEFETKRI